MRFFSLRYSFFAIAFTALISTASVWSWAKDQSRAAPEIDTGFSARNEVTASKHMVAAANGLASNAGLEILRKGGSAVDAAIAVQLVLNLVEPQSSGIGGGAFLLHFDGLTRKLTSFDGREVAPAAVSEKLFLKENGKPLGFREAVHSGRSIGVPGLIAMFALAHKTYGKLRWSELFEPAIKLSENGFAVSPRLHKMLTRRGMAYFNEEGQRLFYLPDGAAVPIGHLMKNPNFATTLRDIASAGPAGFYRGQIADAIIRTTQQAPNAASKMTLEDLANYRAIERDTICGDYRGFKICGMAQPSSGGLSVAMTLALLEPFDLGDMPLNPRALHLIAEAEKLTFADRNRYMADPQFTNQPEGFLNKDYLAKRRQLIAEKSAIARALAGEVPLAQKSHYGVDSTVENGGTSHISIVDKDGNIVSLTSSIEGAFGSGQMVAGFLLNNQLTDFSFRPTDAEGRLIANRVEPLKRPRSSMAPTIVFDKAGEPRLVLGSPGGSRIILYVIKAIIAHLDWGLGARDSVALANFGSRNGPFELEDFAGAALVKKALEEKGQSVRMAIMTSGAQMIVIRGRDLMGGADPRREGEVVGD